MGNANNHRINKSKGRKHNNNNNNNNNNDDHKESMSTSSGNGEFKISERRFKQLALKSLQKLQTENRELTPIAHFKFRRNKYHGEKLLPVFIPEHDKYVAISFWFNQSAERGRTQASAVCLDLTDMKNKANLIQTVPNDSWLNQAKENMTINNLTIGLNNTPATIKK